MNARVYKGIFFSILAALLLGAGIQTVAAKDKPPQKEAPLYPNTQRKEPKLEMPPGAQKDLSKAFDLMQDNKNDEALPIVQKIADDSRAGNYAHALAEQALGQIAYDKQDNAAAEKHFRAAYDANGLPNNQHFTMLYNIANLQVQDEKYQDALTTLDDYFKGTGGGRPESYALQGNAFYRLDKYQEAVDAENKAISMTDKPSDGWSQILIASYAALDQNDKAAEVIEKQLAKAPGDAKLTEQLGKVYINGKLYAKAETLLDSSKDTLSPDTKYLLYRELGAAYSQDEKTEPKAIDAFAKASLYAKTGEVDYYRGSLLVQNDRAKEAVDSLKQAIAKGGLKEPGKAYLLLGDAYNQIDNNAEATAAWQKAKGYPESQKAAEQRLKAGSHVIIKKQ